VTYLRSFSLWLASLVLVAGYAVSTADHVTSRADRIAALESIIRCPSCENLSVAQSTATTSLAVRRFITRAVTKGRSDSDIVNSLENTYGPSILLRPATTGWGAVLVIAPVGVGAVLLLWWVRGRRR
jgi:cytochrome c-type biogenesis protein CcmH